MKKRIPCLIFLFCVYGILSAQGNLYSIQSGVIHFSSDAPLELIEARSNELKGLIDMNKRTFAFAVEIKSFEGFNSPLQQEHFHERYLETEQYDRATFSGKLIEQVDLTQPGEYEVRAKGILNIHGVEQERIIRSKLIVTDRGLEINSRFSVLLAEHNIRIPRMVSQKIAEEIVVDIQAELAKK